MKIRILIVDDHFMARIGLAVPINDEPDLVVVAEAGDAAQALALYRTHRPDVVTMDYRMPGPDGVAAASAILQEFAGARILMLSIFEGEEDLHRAVQAGVRGYLTKGATPAEVVATIRRIHAGEKVFAPGLAARLAARAGREDLSTRELEVLRHLVQGHTNKEISATLHISTSLVKVHVAKILQKLGAIDRTRAATLAIERGIVHLD